MPPSPTLSNTAMVSPDTMSSRHSSPAKTSRICYQPPPPPHHLQHQVIDEAVSTRIPLSISTHHQLASPADHPHSSISGISGIHSDVNKKIQKKKSNENQCKIPILMCFGIVCLNFSNVVRFGSSSVQKFSNNTNITNCRPSFSIVVSFITSSSSSPSSASSIARSTSTLTSTTCRLCTATRNQSVSLFN